MGVTKTHKLKETVDDPPGLPGPGRECENRENGSDTTSTVSWGWRGWRIGWEWWISPDLDVPLGLSGSLTDWMNEWTYAYKNVWNECKRMHASMHVITKASFSIQLSVFTKISLTELEQIGKSGLSLAVTADSVPRPAHLGSCGFWKRKLFQLTTMRFATSDNKTPTKKNKVPKMLQNPLVFSGAFLLFWVGVAGFSLVWNAQWKGWGWW